MKTKLSPFVLAPLALLLAMQGVQAMTLGDLQLRSYIGQRFKADIPYRLGANERLLEDCHLIRQTNSDVAYIGTATLQLIPRGDGSTGLIRITSQKPAEEPIMGFALQVECDNINLTREFTVFLDPAPIVDTPVAPEKPAVTSLEAKRAASSGTVLKKDSSLTQIAQRYYSPGSKQYERYLQKLKRSNPDLAPDEVIAAGSEVNIPARPKVSSSLSTVPKSPSPPAASVDQGVLKLEGNERRAPVTTVKANPDAYVKELEAKVLELTELRKKLQLEIAALDQQLAQNTLAAQKLSASAAAAVKASNVAAVPLVNPASNPVPNPVASAVASAPANVVNQSKAQAVAAPVEQKPHETVKRSVDDGIAWQWPTAGLLALFGLGAWWMRRRAAEDSLDAIASQSVLSVLKTNYAPRQAAPTELSLIQQAHSAFQVSDAEATSLEQAQFLLAHGDTFRALELLQQLVEADPQDVERWLMLFRVYRQQGMKSDYIRLAQQFRAQEPQPADDDWELVRSIGYKLAPEAELFARVETKPAPAPSPVKEAPVDLAIENLAMASQQPPATEDPEAINLIDMFQPKPKPEAPPVAKLSPSLSEGDAIAVPELSLMNHQEDISSLEKFEFDVKEIEFDDEKDGKNTSKA